MDIKDFLNEPEIKELVAQNDLNAVYGLLPYWDRDKLTAYLLELGISADRIIEYFTDTIPDHAFQKCSSLTSIAIPDSVASIGDHAFYACENLTSVVIPEGVTQIPYYGFAYCKNLTNIVIPDSVTAIDKSAFVECTSLTSVVIPDTVTSIGDGAFANCKKLKDVYFKGSQKQWRQIKIRRSNTALIRARIHFAK